jgi:Mce-associated membrane protein
MNTTEIEERVAEEQQEPVGTTDADMPDDVEASGQLSEPVPSRRHRLQLFALLGIALVVLVSGLFAWWQVEHDEERALAETRDAVLIAGRQHIQTLQSLDYRSIDKGLDAWLDVTTGTLHDQLKSVGEKERQLLADQKKISTAKVIDAAVLNLDGDSATVIAAIEVTVADDPSAGTDPTVKRNRFSADLVKVKGRWKLESIGQVPVSLS